MNFIQKNIEYVNMLNVLIKEKKITNTIKHESNSIVK